jgi:hypothetical protein
MGSIGTIECATPQHGNVEAVMCACFPSNDFTIEGGTQNEMGVATSRFIEE